MASQQHYDNLLGSVYSWMMGDFNTCVDDATHIFNACGVTTGRHAIDLGCGHGIHSLALAQKGYSVTAIDNCQALLDELMTQANHYSINCIFADLTDNTRWPTQAECIVCMGDTLCHLDSLTHVETLIHNIANTLTPNGICIVSFRDYTQTPLRGAARFIPVKSDATRIMTCFIEEAGNYINVTDLLHELIKGVWTLHTSEYRKLKLAPQTILDLFALNGLRAEQKTGLGRMVHIIATKP